MVIGCSLFNNPGEGNLEFDVETACSREFIDDPDGPFYFEFAIPKPFHPNYIDVNSAYELVCPTHEKSSIPNLVVLKEYIRQAFITILKEELSSWGDNILLNAYMKQLKKGDTVKFGLRDSRGEIINSSQSPYFTAFDGVVASNNGIKVKIDSKSYQKVGRRSFDITTGESSGPACLVGDGHGLCFYFIEVPSDFLPDTFMKVVELGPKNLTILSETQRDTFMDDFPF